MAISSNKKISDFSLCKIADDVFFVDFQFLCKSLATNYYFFCIFLNFPVTCLTINFTIGISSCLNFEIPLMVLISTSDKFNSRIPSFLFFGISDDSLAKFVNWDLLLNFEIPDDSPCYVWQCYRCVNLKGCLGVRCYKCKCIGALQYTTLIFRFSFLWVLARIKKETMHLYLIAITLFITTLLSLILQYHKYTYEYTLICIASCCSSS